ncbi:MAG: hypothetical protein J5950_10835 [Clostridia bacterium]|nr:hypothetical protein [Clostridia bacterium]
MGDVMMQIANFFNKSGSMNTVVWFSVLMIVCIILALSYRKELAGLAIASAVCLFVSFSPLSLAIQSVIFAALTAAWLFASKKTEKGSEKTEGENLQNE